MEIKFTCASVSESAQTIRTSQFEGRTFNYGEQYRIIFKNGVSALATVNRTDGSTLYISSSSFPRGLSRARVGQPVVRSIKGLRKVK